MFKMFVFANRDAMPAGQSQVPENDGNIDAWAEDDQRLLIALGRCCCQFILISLLNVYMFFHFCLKIDVN